MTRKQLGRGRTLWPLPQIQMLQDLADHLRLLDPGDDLLFAATVGTTKWLNLERRLLCNRDVLLGV